jgi:GntR family transcriptional regulator/MocR family aminotransferase
MRTLYAGRLTALIEGGRKYLGGVLELSDVRAGLYTVGFLRNGMGSRQAEKLAAAQGIEVLGLDRFILKRPDPKGLLIGFAGYDETKIRDGLIRLAKALR